MCSRSSIILASAFASLLLVSCEDAAPNLVVQSVIPATKECVYELDSTLEISKGSYDAFCGKNYYITVRVISLMRVRGDATRPRSEPNVVQFEAAEIQLETLQGVAIAPKFSTPVFATVNPGDSSTPGKTLVQIEIVPKALVKSVQKHDDYETLTATIKLFGTTAGGTEVESDEFTFPFEVCSKCYTLQTAGLGCTPDDAQKDFLDTLSTCQNGRGYDGAFCQYCADTDEVL
jgi:hypothetical protein